MFDAIFFAVVLGMLMYNFFKQSKEDDKKRAEQEALEKQRELEDFNRRLMEYLRNN